MGDANNDDLRVSFDSRLKLKFLGSQITTDAGLLAYRELDEALGLTEMAGDLLGDGRLGNRSQGVFWSSGWVKEETDLDSDWQIGNDVEHVVATIFRPPRYSA